MVQRFVDHVENDRVKHDDSSYIHASTNLFALRSSMVDCLEFHCEV